MAVTPAVVGGAGAAVVGGGSPTIVVGGGTNTTDPAGPCGPGSPAGPGGPVGPTAGTVTVGTVLDGGPVVGGASPADGRGWPGLTAAGAVPAGIGMTGLPTMTAMVNAPDAAASTTTSR